jgi:MHS family alpha-ketoglutarate permease-like MFS transporter
MSSFTEIEGKIVQPSRKDIRKSLIASGVGNLLEWYDWTIYAVASIYIASALFDKANPTSALLNTLAVFAVGFVSRPINYIAEHLGYTDVTNFSRAFKRWTGKTPRRFE